MRRPGRGFTLVEVLVATALLSLVLLALGSAMRSMAQTEQRLDARLKAADETRVAAQFLRATLGRVSNRRNAASTQPGASQYLFAGAPGAVAWLGIMPARHGAGGRHYFRLAAEAVDGRTALVLRFVPWNGAATFPDWARADSRVLLADLARFQVDYAEDGERTTWHPQWAQPQRLPDRVRLTVASSSGGEWPPFIVALRQLPMGDGGRGGFSLGPE